MFTVLHVRSHLYPAILLVFHKEMHLVVAVEHSNIIHLWREPVALRQREPILDNRAIQRDARVVDRHRQPLLGLARLVRVVSQLEHFLPVGMLIRGNPDNGDGSRRVLFRVLFSLLLIL